MIRVLAFSWSPEEREVIAEQLAGLFLVDDAEIMAPTHLWEVHQRAATCARLLVPLQVSPAMGQAIVTMHVRGWDLAVLEGRLGRSPPNVELLDPWTGRTWEATALIPSPEEGALLLGQTPFEEGEAVCTDEGDTFEGLPTSTYGEE